MDEVYSVIPVFDKYYNNYYISRNGENIASDDISSFFLPVGLYSLFESVSSDPKASVEIPLMSYICIDHNRLVRYSEPGDL